MSKANREQRRKAKRQEARRRESVSPLKRLARMPGETECWISDNLDIKNRQAQAFVHKSAGGLTGVACFLVDRGVVGLKDAWTRMCVPKSEIRDIVDKCERGGIPMRRATLDEVRQLVAGGIKWAHENGMRLPKEWQKTASLIGGVDNWTSADVSKFAKEFVGHPEDLRQRLIGQTFDSYLKRIDINFVFSISAPYMDQETGEYTPAGPSDWDEDQPQAADFDPDEQLNNIAEQLSPVAAELAEKTSAFLREHDRSPSTELSEAWVSVILASMIATASAPKASVRKTADLNAKILDNLSGRIDPDRRAEYETGIDQALEFLQTDPAMINNAILDSGMVDSPD